MMIKKTKQKQNLTMFVNGSASAAGSVGKLNTPTVDLFLSEIDDSDIISLFAKVSMDLPEAKTLIAGLTRAIASAEEHAEEQAAETREALQRDPALGNWPYY